MTAVSELAASVFAAPGSPAAPAAPAAESVPGAPAPPDRMFNQDLAGLDEQALLAIVALLPRASERRVAACALLVARYQGLVWSCVRQYSRGPELTEDLMQVGYVGLLKAINNFDPAIGRNLATYAQPCITGEIKRHFRDKRWQIHVKRSEQELILRIRAATGPLTQDLGRTPGESDLARHLGVSVADVRQAQQAELAFQPTSLDAPLPGQPGTSTVADYLGQEDPRLEHMLSMQAVATHWGELTLREQEILLLGFRGGLTQTEIGRRLQISQMHVSRLRAHALGHLRSRLLDLEPAEPVKPARTVAGIRGRIAGESW
ncbi:MAG TPA: sigma-70 family RNA polymerase sigma factor [Streptosporangiaceae bacterium]|nr:sigma-70 family RNA polymerase sigma factor [Streptosporangiaceae bacterium]